MKEHVKGMNFISKKKALPNSLECLQINNELYTLSNSCSGLSHD